MKAALQSFWQSLLPRQRLLLGVAVAVVAMSVWWLWWWEPLQHGTQTERQRLAQQQGVLAWLQAVAPELEAMQQRQAGLAEWGDQSLLGLTDDSARRAGLAGALTRIEPIGEDRVRVWLDGAEYAVAMAWLQALSAQYPIAVEQLAVERSSAPARVSLRVTLTRRM